MKKIIIGLTMFLMFNLISGVRFLDESILFGDELETHINIINNENEDINNINIRMYIPALGTMVYGNTLDIESNGKQGSFLFWDADAEQGDYLVRISATSDKKRDVTYRYITVR